MTLVVDASVAVAAAFAPRGFNEFRRESLVAPALMWSEARSTLRVALWREQISQADAEAALEQLEAAPVERVDPPGLGRAAWDLAVEFGWARTYDAEYVATARLMGCRLVTLDERLRRGTARLGIVVSPAEL